MENDKAESRPEYSEGGLVPDRSWSGEWSVPTGVRSLRDDFAMLVVNTILGEDPSLPFGNPDEIDELAVNCYAVADAMMKARG